MKLSKVQQRVLAYLAEPRTSQEVADHLGWQVNAVYGPLRILQRLGVVDKHAAHAHAKAIYVANGKRIQWDPVYMTYTPTSTMVMGVRL